MIRVCVAVCLIALACLHAPAFAESRSRGSLGLGLVVGDPTGVTAEYYPRSSGFGQAVELTLGLETFDDGHTYVHLIWKFTPHLLDATHGGMSLPRTILVSLVFALAIASIAAVRRSSLLAPIVSGGAARR